MNNTNNALETLVQRDKQIKKANDKLKASINELDAELETTTNALSNHANDTNIHTSKEELIKFIVDHLESLDLGITKEVVSELPTENISDNTLYFVPNDKGSRDEYLYINDKWELVGSTETNFTDYYTKLETDTLLEDKANKSDLSTVATSGSYKDLLDKPVIPEGADLSDYYNKGETDNLLNSKANTSDLAVVAKSGNYNDLNNTPTIPTKVSDLTNDSGYITGVAWGDVTDKPILSAVAISGNYNDLSNKPTIPTVNNATLTIQKNGTIVNTFTANSSKNVTANITVPTKTSDLTNDSGYITSVSWNDVTSKPELSQVAISGSYSDLNGTPTIPTKTSQLINDSGFLTSSSGVITSVSWSDITNKPNFSTVATSGSYTDLSNTPTIPTKVSQLENDMGFGTGGDTNDCVHKTGDETIAGTKKFTSDINRKYTAVDITTTPTSDMYAHINFVDKNDKTVAYIQYAQKSNGVDYIGLRVRDKNSTTWGVQLNTNKEFVPLGNNSYSLGSSSYKWANVYATTFNGNLSGTIASSTTATTQATTDNSTRIATTAWVRTYVNSVAGSNTVGSSVSAYWSNSSNVTATGQASAGGKYPACYSDYITKTPTVGTIYSGAQLYTVLNTSASATGYTSNSIYFTNNKAQATFSNPISATGKYLCTTANAVRLRAYTTSGSSSSVGTSSVVDNTSTKSIFIRVQ